MTAIYAAWDGGQAGAVLMPKHLGGENMEATRRSFLRGVMALTVVSVTGLPALADIPTIYSDGLHDDTAGLQALFDGKPFRVEGDVIADAEGYVSNGNFRISETLKISRTGVVVAYNKFTWTGAPNKCVVQFLTDGTPLVFVHNDLLKLAI